MALSKPYFADEQVGSALQTTTWLFKSIKQTATATGKQDRYIFMQNRSLLREQSKRGKAERAFMRAQKD